MRTPSRSFACWFSLLAALVLWWVPSQGCAQIRPAEITETQSVLSPYRHSGRLLVRQGNREYGGTASYIRRYTGLTAGHMLYDSKKGFSTDAHYQPALYAGASVPVTVGFFAVLSGYQSAAVRPASDAAFGQDIGYLVFTKPASNDEWALWSADPSTLLGGTNYQIIGYAAESFPGDEQAEVRTNSSYKLLLAPGLYESTAYYSEEGMSGGPVYYADRQGQLRVAAVTVGGTSPPDPAYSDVRAITADEEKLFLNAEYVQGMITGGFITGPGQAAPGSKARYRTGVVFSDGAKETAAFSSRYNEVQLAATGAYKKLVGITPLGSGKYKVAFSPAIPRGARVKFRLFRSTVSRPEQQALSTYSVTVQ